MADDLNSSNEGPAATRHIGKAVKEIVAEQERLAARGRLATPLERAAKALHESTKSVRYIRDPENLSATPVEHPDPLWLSWEDLNEGARAYCRTRVRAVLTAIRDIDLATEDDSEINMLIRGRAVLPEHDEPMLEDAANCWRVMIGAMLEDDADLSGESERQAGLGYVVTLTDPPARYSPDIDMNTEPGDVCNTEGDLRSAPIMGGKGHVAVKSGRVWVTPEQARLAAAHGWSVFWGRSSDGQLVQVFR